MSELLEQSPQPNTTTYPSNDAVYFNIDNTKQNTQSNGLDSSLTAQGRAAFIVKVYFLLIMELVVTFGMCLLSQYVKAYQQFQLDYAWVLVFPVLLIIGIMISVMCVPVTRQYPLDMVMLLFFVLSYGYLISFACSAVQQEVEGPVVLIAVAITLIITIAITLYAFFVKANYLVLFGIVIVVSVTSILVLIIALISMAPVMVSIYCGLAVIIYGIYLVVVTKMVIGGDNQMVAFPLDNYIIASLILYLYIMRMFLMILRIVANSRR